MNPSPNSGPNLLIRNNLSHQPGLFSKISPPNSGILARLLDVLEAHLDDLDLKSGSLYLLVPTSRATLHRFLRRNIGLSTSDFLNRYRVSRSLPLLSDLSRDINQIAAAVGMNSSAYTRAFKQEFGQTPSSFRRFLPVFP